MGGLTADALTSDPASTLLSACALQICVGTAHVQPMPIWSQ